MRICDLLKPVGIDLNGQPAPKEAMIEQLVALMERTGALSNPDQYRKDVLAREASGTTGMGDGIAIPHAKSAGVTRAQLAAMRVAAGTDYEALDGAPTQLFFLIAVPEQANDAHLKVLSRLSTLLMDEPFRKNLMEATDEEAFLEVIARKEAEKFPDDFAAQPQAPALDHYDLLAVTGCPTGIAHTYMAAEGLTNKAKELGYTIKVETHGSTGIENALSAEEIRQAKGIIVACDVGVNKDRFNGKRVVDTRVSDGFNKPQALIEEVLQEDRPLYKAQKEVQEEAPNAGGVGQSLYKHLMNGVSHMLPFVVGGGILIALAFLLDDYTIDPANFGSNTPLAAFFKEVGGAAFSFMLPVLAGFIAMSIADRPGLALGMVGGFLANQGGAGFLGALAAGFLAGYLILALRKLTAPLPKSMDGVKPMLIFPVLGLLGIGALMLLVLNPPLATVNNAITNWLNNMGSASKLVLGALVAGMMAVDMGGPINKAAYVFGTASLASGSSAVMAAVMAGGMVPPLALSLAMLFFKNKFTAKDRQSIPTNFIMGLSFITEGAIPFAAADPLRVLPSCMVGSALTGMLSMLFNCSLRAPHGGIWVIGVVENPIMYLVAIVAGSLVAALLLGLLKKKVPQA